MTTIKRIIKEAPSFLRAQAEIDDLITQCDKNYADYKVILISKYYQKSMQRTYYFKTIHLK